MFRIRIYEKLKGVVEMMTSYDTLEDIAFSYYNYEPLLSEFRCFGYDDGSSVVEVNEIGKKNLKD